ncbi:MAG: radical SAM protein [Candidatus Pelethousia sp.]|nr:radical SAM protein [Candidatus Pelethousia sp.]
MSGCSLCPRRCGVDRSRETSACGAPSTPYIARAALHMWEEPCLSGTRGAGTIFFCGCNMDCLFCQNYTISHGAVGSRMNAEALASLMLHLQEMGAHNIDLVTPTPHLQVLLPALQLAKAQGLSIPVVYNTNGYELVESLKSLEGLVDIYLPDLKYVSAVAAQKYSGVADYFQYAAPAILEMQRQCGVLQLDEKGMARKGLIVRHLVLPGSVDEARGVMDFIKQNLPKDTQISLMSQYVPCHRAIHPPINRRLTRKEYERSLDYCLSLGLQRVFIQELSAADSSYTPHFDGEIV